MQKFRLIGLTPPGLTDSSIAIAASRAEGLGILDLEYVQDEQAALAAVVKLAQYARGAWGVKLDGGDEEFFGSLIRNVPENIKFVILTPTGLTILRRQVQALHKHKITVLLETSSVEQAIAGVKARVDSLIAKGNEAGGWVGEETTFVLLQRLLASIPLPIWAQGGIGLHTVAACYAAGAVGVVLDGQFALTPESSLPERAKAIISRMDGSETVCLGEEIGAPCRMYIRPGLPVVENLFQLKEALDEDSGTSPENLKTWHREVRTRVGWGSPERNLWLLGQDASFAAPLAQRFKTVGGILEGMRQAIDEHVRSARELKPLDSAAPLARSHGTHYPVVQGPMTRVSDRAAFAAKVAEAGGLPFLALALLRASEVKALLEETIQLLGNQPWGVGILGFVPLELRQEQLNVIQTYKPPFALIAGGRPDQARALEQQGISTYLHVPSPELLKMFLRNRARRFVFEGRECGGHVGPCSSFVLWNTLIDALLESVSADEIVDCHILFAGGIHDALSSAMVATMAAPLVERGARVGVLLGTAYLFTEEAVVTGAILDGYQQEAIQSLQTVLLESGPGHAIRCAITPYTEEFKREKKRMSKEGRSTEEISTALEDLNLGRLRTSSKGIKRNLQYEQDPQVPKLLSVGEEEQHARGMYMIGQLAALRDKTCKMVELHREISVKGSQRLSELEDPGLSHSSAQLTERPCDVAIIGMACLMPKAHDLNTYWENILKKVDCITEVPKDRWDWKLYFDTDRKARDKVYSRWGGFLDAVPFNPMRYGMPPSSLPSIEPLQLLTLETVWAAIRDAGYEEREFPKERTAVILGTGSGIGELQQYYAFRSNLPTFFHDVSKDLLSQLPEWTEDSFAGILPNVTAGRVANRFDLGGVNYTVDAACASSLAAVYAAVKELENKTSDMVIVGGADTLQNPYTYFCFGSTLALSPTGRCRPFDESASGMCISEGIAVLVLKRLSDAERDGDRVYSVIKGVGGSSDGRAKGLTAPHPEGQARALNRAYAKAGVSPATVGLIEAHGTGTVVGDRAEIETLRRVFEAGGAAQQSSALGSVKSMIGHTKCTAGVASLIKVAMALYHKVLPPTLGVEKPNASLAGGPFYVNTQLRPWIHGTPDQPRRAGVSAFGFGGTNFHAVVEEYTDSFLDSTREAVSQDWSSELLLWAGPSREELLAAIDSLRQALAQGAKPPLHDLAYTLWQHAKDRPDPKLAVVVNSLDDLRQKLAWAGEALRKPGNIEDPRGIYFTEEPLAREGKVAFLFPGQGSQFPDMLGELAIQFPEVRKRFELADLILSDRYPRPLSSYIFSPPRFNQEEELKCQQALTKTNMAQPALGAAGMGLFHLLQALDVKPNMVAGHSYGEYVALCAAGVFSEEVLYSLSEARGRFIIEAAGQDLWTMAAVEAGQERIIDVLRSVENVWVANLNAPSQTVISGTRAGIEEATKCLEANGMRVRPIPVSCAFHSPVVGPARDRLAEFISTIAFAEPKLEVFSNTSAEPYPQTSKAIAALLSDHLIRPVEFVREIEAMYQSGARIFLEVGPRSVLTNLTKQILNEQAHVAVSLDVTGRSNLLQLHHVLGQLAAHGVQIQVDRLYQRKDIHQLDLTALVEETRERPLPSTTWMVDGGQAWPIGEAKGIKTSGELQMQDRALHDEKAQIPASGPPELTADSPPGFPAPESRRQSPKPPSSPALGNEVESIMLQFQRLMEQFLKTQREVMLAYLRSSTERETLPSEVSTSAKTPDFAHAIEELSQIKTTYGIIDRIDNALRSQAEEPKEELHLPSETISTRKAEPAIDREQLTAHLLQIVSERTGYPQEMINLNLDLEADLGIDSIKWVEIIGTLQESYFSIDEEQTQAAMEELTKIKTLRGIIDWIDSALRSRSGEAAEESIDPQAKEGSCQPCAETDEDSVVEVPSRFFLKAVDIPVEDRPLQISPNSIFLITDEGQGISQAMAEELRRHGGRVALVQMGHKVRKTSRDAYSADLTDPAAVAKLLKLIRKKLGPIAGVIHLLPLKERTPFEEMDLGDWRKRIRMEVKSLFYLAKASSEDLKNAAVDGGGWLITATGMGGAFASDMEIPGSIFPGQGGIAGLVKTLAIEWPAVHCKAVDLDPEEPSTTLANHLLREMACADGEVEVGYKGSRRLILRVSRMPLDKGRPASLIMDSSWVVVVTGGARGITAEAALELAERYRPTLLLIGRSPLPEGQEGPETVGLSSPRELKAALIERMRRENGLVTPTQVEAAYTRLCQEREMRSNLDAMKQAGARVHYYQVDVCEEQAFGQLIDEVYRNYGRLDLFIHGAGIIQDKLIEDKTPDSFDSVFDTKADSALILSRKLRSDSLRFLVFFSSVVGRFGNRGQTDYAAANEVLNKLAVYLDRKWPGRVVAINWSPWAKTGMASSEVQRKLTERGLQLIHPPAGRRILDEELRYGRKGQVEVVIGDGPWEIVESAHTSSIHDALPLLYGVSLKGANNGSAELIKTLDPARDRYLLDHQMDGKPVLPLAMAMELMAEVVQRGWPEWKVVGICSLRVLRGIILNNGALDIRIVAIPHDYSSEDSVLEVDVEITEMDRADHLSYHATVQIAKQLPTPPPFEPSMLSELSPFPMTVDEAYRRWLFHGPCFQGISKIEGFNNKGICGVLIPSSPDRWLLQKALGQWLIDPGLLDSGFQLVLLWERAHFDMTTLPSGFKSFRRFGSPSGLPVQCCVKANSSAGGHTLIANFYFLDAEGRLMSLLEEAECACSKSLNRLAKLSASG